MKLFSTYDVKAKFFVKLFQESSSIAALRGFDVAVNEADSIFSRFPDDFCLMEIAEFDQQTGALIPHTSPLNLGSARSVLRQPTEQNTLPFDPVHKAERNVR